MKLRLPHKFQAALIAAIASVGFTLPQTEAATVSYDVFSDLTYTKSNGANVSTTENYASQGGGWNADYVNFSLGENAFTLSGTEDILTFHYVTHVPANGAAVMTLIDTDNVALSTGWGKYDDGKRISYGTTTNTGGNFYKFKDKTEGYKVVVTETGYFAGSGYADCTVDGTIQWNATSGQYELTMTNTVNGVTSTAQTLGLGANSLSFDRINVGLEGKGGNTYKLSDFTMTYTTPGAPVVTDYVWNGTTGQQAWNLVETNTNWLLGEAEVFYETGKNVIFNEVDGVSKQVDVAAGIQAGKVNVNAAGYTFNLVEGGLSANAVTLADGASLTISGSGTFAVTGNATLGTGAGITVGEGTTLKVSDAAVAKALMMSNAVTNNGIFEIAGDVTLDNGVSTAMGGTLKVDSGVTLKLSQSKDLPTSIESFTSVELAGGNLWANTTMRTINALSVTGVSQISFTDFPNDYANNPTKFTGTTSIAGGKTLTIYTNYKSSIQIAGLAGAGTLELTTADKSDNGENVTIDSLEGFSGNISLAPGNANNPVRVTASLGDADVSMGTLSLNGNSAAATDTKHTFYKLTGEHNLTMTGIDGTNGEVSLTVPTLTLNTDSNHSYTGSLSISGQLVKTGAGAQTLGGYEMHKAMDVQAGTLVLTGMYDITHIEMDPGVTYTYQDEQGQTAPEAVGGFRATNGSKTVYTKDASAIVTDGAATYKLDGKDVQLTDGKYNYMPEADLTTLWVNGSTPLSYDTYYAASGEETKALTTAQVADGATLVIGTNAVGTLAFQENGTTINLDGSGTVNAISGTGTLNLNGTVTLGSSLTVGNGETFATSGTGSLNAGQLNANGGTIAFSCDSVSIDSVTTNGSATVVFNGGSATIGAIATKQGSTIQFSNKEGAESSSYSFDTFELGGNTANAARWLVVDANVTVEGKKDTLTKGAVRATISNDWGIDGGGVKVDGILNLAGEISMDGPESNYIKGAGIINTTGLNLCNGSTTYIQDGITVNITTSAGIHRRNNNADLHFANATLAAVNDEEGAGADWTLQSDYSHVYLDDSTNGTTFKAASNRTITLASAMEGTGKLVKAGEGVVKLTGANTYSGGTVVNAGTLLAQNASALGTGVVNITGGNLVIGAVMNDYSANEFHNIGGTLTMNDGSKLTMFATGDTRTYDLGNVVVNGSAGIVTKVNNSCFNAQLNMTSLVSAADGAEIVLASGAQYTLATVFSLNTNQTAAYNGTITVMESQTNSGARPVALNVALGADAAEADALKGAVIVLDNANNDGNLVGLGLGSDVTVKGIDSGNTATNGTHVIFAGAATTDNGSFSSSGDARTLTVDTAGTDHATRAKVLDKVNLVKQGAGTQTFSGDMSSFNGSVSAVGGTLNVLNAESLAVQNVHIGEGAVFGVYSGDTATASTGTEGSIAITENNVLSALENATLNANLVMEAGSTLDVSYAQDSYGLIMGSSVTLKEGVLLQDSMHQQQYPDINDFLFEYLSHNDYYYLYDSVDELYIQQGGTTKQVYELNFKDWRHFDMDASSVFTNLSENTYALVYSWDGSNVGSVALTLIPEPTTGTLSLLALAVLAARRRRK